MAKAKRTRWDEDNELALNPWAFVAAFVLIGGLVGLGVLLAVL